MNSGSKSPLPALAHIVLLTIVLVTPPFDFYGLNQDKILYFTGLTFLGLSIHLYINNEKNWMRIDTIFIISFIVVHFQWPIMMAVFDLEPIFGFQAKSVSSFGDYAVWLAALSILSWMTGHAFGPAILKMSPTRVRLDLNKYNILFSVSLISFIVSAGQEFFSRSLYTTSIEGLNQTISGIAAYISDIVEITALSLLAILGYNRISEKKNDKSTGKKIILKEYIAMGLIIVYMITYLLGGERGQLVQIIIGATLIYATNIRAFRLPVFAMTIFGGFLALTAIAIVRAILDYDQLGDFLNYGLWDISSNLAQSIVPLTQAIPMLEENGGSYLGMLWVSMILGVIPFAQNIFLQVTELSIENISAGVLITNYTLGAGASTGIGINLVADLYLNGGVPGVILLSATLGYFSRLMAIWLQGRHGFLRFLIAVIFAAFSIYIARSSILITLKPMIWASAAALLLAFDSRRGDVSTGHRAALKRERANW